MHRSSYRLVWFSGGIVLALLLLIATANYFINRPAFKTRVEHQVSRALKMPVQFEVLKVKWNGIRVKNLTIPYLENSTNTPFAQAKVLGLSFSFWRLLFGQIVLDSISLHAPQVILQETPKGKIELPRLTQKQKTQLAANASVEAIQTDASEEKGSPDFTKPMPQNISNAEKFRPRSKNRLSIDQVKVDEGLFQYRNEKQKIMVSCEGIEGAGDFLTTPSEMKSQGQLRVETIFIEPNIKLNQFKSPVIYTNEVFLLPKVEAKLYEGTLTGFFRTRFDKEKKPFRTKLQIRDFDLENFLKERSKDDSPIEGRADLNFEGHGQFENTENIEGAGDFLVKSFKAEGLKFFREIGQVVGMSGLSDVTFDQVVGQFHIKDQHVVFDRIESKPKKSATYLLGKGTIDFKGNLNFDGALTLNSGLIGGLAQLLKKIQNKDSGNEITIPFKVTGTTEHPKIQVIKTDFAEGAIKDLFDLIPEIQF